MQNSVRCRNARLDSFETTVGTSPILRFLSGAMPANCAAAETGTILAELTLPSDWLAAASGGTKSKSGTWQDVSANNAGTAGYYRIYDSGLTTCDEQGTVGMAVPLTTNALTAAASNVLNFASTTGVSIGQVISGTGIVPGSTVLAFTGTTVTMSLASVAGVANATAITFSGDITLNNTVFAPGQDVQITAYTKTANNA